jgi:hypothetical protein
MISDLTTSQTLTSRRTARTLRLPIGFGRSVIVAASAGGRMISAIKAFAKAPVLPYAALFEANVLVSLLKEREDYEPDRFASGFPFATSLWPRE